MPDRFTGREVLPKLTRCNAELIEERLYVANTGLHVVFESRPVKGPTANECTSFHVARSALERDGLEENTTEEITVYLRDANWTFFIWIPKDVAHGDSRKFAMQYAHELAHHRQHLDPNILVKPKAFLRSWKKHHSPHNEAEKRADEMDAHKVVLGVFENIFGEEGLQSYIKEQSRDSRMANFFARLNALLREYEAYCRG
jgi:hypothetical protein